MAKVAVQRALGDMQLLADGADAQATLAVQRLRRHGGGLGLGGQTLGTATDPAPRPCGRQARLSPLADQLALELGQRKAIRACFNGEVVTEVTGLTGKALGEFMAHFKRAQGDGMDNLPLLSTQQIRELISGEFHQYGKSAAKVPAPGISY